MAEIVAGDILDIKRGIICHQANCLGSMGSGIARAIRDKYPVSYVEYQKAYKKGQLKLGNVVFVPVDTALAVAHICGQYDYGRKKKQYTNYRALAMGLAKVTEIRAGIVGERLPIFIPYGIGCGLGGGSWPTVMGLIEQYAPDATIIQLARR